MQERLRYKSTCFFSSFIATIEKDMKIAFFELEKWEEDYVKKRFEGNEIVFYDTPLTNENVSKIKDFDAISIFIYSFITKELIDKLPNLKNISTRSTGFDHIDSAYCKEKNILICTVPHYGTHTVAEHTFALILALSRNLYKSIEQTKRADFDLNELTGFDLYDKTIGIVGFGDIGTSVVRIAKGFGMHVVVFSHHPDEDIARKLDISFLPLNDLFSISDILTLHVPYTKENYHPINKKNIKKFKKGSLLINTARGALVETEAIVYGLQKEILRGVGLDVLEDEDSIKEERQILTQHFMKNSNFKTLYYDHFLMAKDNVIITPHNAFNSTEALQLILDATVDNLLFFAQNKPQNTI